MSRDDDLLDQMSREILSQMNEATDTEIMDDRPVHVIDNGALPEISDAEPIDPEDEFFGDSDPEVLESSRDEQVIGMTENVRGRSTGVFRDDFVEHVRALSRARIGPRGELLDDFDQMSQMQGQEHEALQARAPFSRDNPPSVLNGVLGGQVELVPGDPAVTVANWVGDDAETTPVTVTLGPVNLPAMPIPAGTEPIRAFAIVQFGTRGFLIPVEVDILQGCQFTVSASQVMVSVGLEAPGGGPYSAPATVAKLTGMLSFKTTQKVTSITRTKYFDSVSPGGSVAAAVPAFARNVFVMRQSSVTAAIRILVFDSGGTIVSIVDLAPGVVLVEPIVLPGDAAFVTVTDTGAGVGSVRMVFGLSL